MMANIKWTRKAAAVVIGLCMASFVLDSFSILPSFTASTPEHHNLRRSLSVAGGGSIRNAVAQFMDPKTTVPKMDHEVAIKLDQRDRIRSLDRSLEFPYPLTCDKNEVLQFLHNNNLIDDQTGEKKFSITLVYHIGMIGNWESVVADQFHILNECGTLDIADQLFLTYSNEKKETLLDFIYPLLGENNRHKIKAIEEAKKKPWEAPAMNNMLKHCNSSPSPKEEVVFYFHSKGTSKWTADWRNKVTTSRSYAYSLYWRKYLEYFTIERPQLCLASLLFGDATSCGPNWRAGNGGSFPNSFYSGNFWSAVCEHINHLEPLKGRGAYTAGEMWIGTWEGKQAKLTTHFKNLYSQLVVPEEYALDGKNQQMSLTGQILNIDKRVYHDVRGGYWEYAVDGDGIPPPPYTFSREMCKATSLQGKIKSDCRPTGTSCLPNLMNYVYFESNGTPYPRFDVDGFRRQMRNKRILFVGSSLARQQVQALVWTLGHTRITWGRVGLNSCTATRKCMVDEDSNITICYQFMGSVASQIYHEGSYTLDHSKRGEQGDSSCLLHDDIIEDISGFDLVIVQSVAWWTGLPSLLESPESPPEWVSKMVPTLYYDGMNALLSRVSQHTKTVLVLGQIGTDCENKTAPEPFRSEDIPDRYGWTMAPKLWDTSLDMIQEEGLRVQVVDAREPLMQSVQAHPAKRGDCLHFCMESAAVNIQLDMIWNEVFSGFIAPEEHAKDLLQENM